MKEKVIMFYNRYVDNTFLNQFISFDKNLKFTINTFENSVPHYPVIEICPNGLGIIINIPKLVNMYTLPPIHYGDGKLLGSIH